MKRFMIVIIVICSLFMFLNCEMISVDNGNEDMDGYSYLTLDKKTFWFDIVKGQSAVGYFTMSNTGNSDNLSWALSETESWLKVFPEDGILKEDEEVTVKIIIDTTGFDAGFFDYNPVITINSESSDLQNSPDYINIYMFIGDYLSGHITGNNETLSGFIILGGDLFVDSGNTLTILPGTIIKTVTENPNWEYTGYPGGANGIVDIIVFGSLIAEGTKQDPIVITAAGEKPEPGSWFGIQQDDNSSSVSMKYAGLRYPKYGIFIYSDVISSPSIENCSFAYTENSGIVDSGPDSSYSYISFYNSGSGFKRQSDNRSTDLAHCVFLDNRLADVSIAAYDGININITDSAFYDPYNDLQYNLHISDKGAVNSTITSDNCFGIKKIFVSGATNSINVINPSLSLLSLGGAGSGFITPWYILDH
jgi:hypothetical protein